MPDDAGRALLGLADEPARLMVAVQGRRDIDVAEAIDALETSEAAQVMAALSLPVAVAVLDSGVLHDAAGILARITDRWAGQLLEGMTPMRRAQLFREVPPVEDARLRAALSPSARRSLDAILAGTSGASDAASEEAQEAIARARRRRRQRRLRRALLVIALLMVAAVVLLGVAAATGTLAIFISGDGGWADLDRGLADGLPSHGLGIMGMDARAYRARRRTPEQSVADGARVARSYTARWGAPRLVLVGYSRGATGGPSFRS